MTTRAEVLAAVLAEHGAEGSRAHVQCLCGEWEHRQTWPGEPDTWFGASYRTHVAAALDAALAAQEGERGGAEAAIEAMHHDDEGAPGFCAECDARYPCPTIRALADPAGALAKHDAAVEAEVRTDLAASVEDLAREPRVRRHRGCLWVDDVRSVVAGRATGQETS